MVGKAEKRYKAPESGKIKKKYVLAKVKPKIPLADKIDAIGGVVDSVVTVMKYLK